MKTTTKTTSEYRERRKSKSTFSFDVLRDILEDYLEIHSLLTTEQRLFLINELEEDGIKADAIDIHPCLSINQKLINILSTKKIQDYWFYYPSQQKIEKRIFKAA